MFFYIKFYHTGNNGSIQAMALLTRKSNILHKMWTKLSILYRKNKSEIPNFHPKLTAGTKSFCHFLPPFFANINVIKAKKEVNDPACGPNPQ